MGFKKSMNRKAYSALTEVEIQQRTNNVVQLNALDLDNYVYPVDGDGDFHFIRFFYKGVPQVKRGIKIKGAIGAEKLQNPNATDMRLIHSSRTELVKGIYNYSHELELQNKSPITISNVLFNISDFIRACDEKDLESATTIECAWIYSQYLNLQVKTGKLKKSSARCKQTRVLGWLRWSGVEAKNSVLFFGSENGSGDNSEHTAYTHHEVKLLSKVMHRVFANYGTHVSKDTQPKICLFFFKGPPQKRYGAEMRVNNHKNPKAWLSTLSASALYLMSLYTGVNLTPLMKMRRSDINYNRMFITKAEQHSLQLNDDAIERIFGKEMEYRGKTYDLKTVKGRAKFNRQQTPFGFSKYGRDFFETWLLLLDKLDAGDYLFPNLNPRYKDKGITDAQLVNFCYLIDEHTEAPRPVNTRFRKTKTEVLITVTNDFIVAAHANNHSPETAMQYYSQGNIENKERTLARSMSAFGALTDGMNKSDAISQAEAKFKDPLTSEEYERLRAKVISNHKVISDTTVGKCTDSFGDKAQRQAREFLKHGLIEENEDIPPCMKFFECLLCENYTITTDVDDIWLLLSFQFLLHQKLSRPAINSMPSSKYKKVQARLMQLAELLMQKDRKSFDAAQCRIAERELHPVWQEESDLNDMFEGINPWQN